MSDPEHADQILTAAARDLRALRAMVDSPEFSEEIFGFHAQQVCEKVLKAWLTLLGKRYPKTHDLKMLIDLLAAEGIDVEGLAQFVDLNAYAVQSSKCC